MGVGVWAWLCGCVLCVCVCVCLCVCVCVCLCVCVCVCVCECVFMTRALGNSSCSSSPALGVPSQRISRLGYADRGFVASRITCV